MLEELRNASKQLHVALEHYIHICSSIRDLCLQGSAIHVVHSQYLALINQELGVAESYETKIQQAKLAIKVTRSHTFNISPINCLPPEILSRIFHMTSAIRPRSKGHIAAVCSLWRSIALGSPTLWSRIHFDPRLPKQFELEQARVRLHVARSGEVPLDFHFGARAENCNTDGYFYSPMKDLCKLIAPRMRSLELDLEDFSGEGRDGRTSSAFNTLLSHCIPGMFTKLVVKDLDRPGFITTTDDEQVHDSALQVRLESTELDCILSPITVLHAMGVFPRWTSHAFHDLVDLRLCRPLEDLYERGIYAIPESQLVAILKASPRLCIFHSDLGITHRLGEGVPVPLVRLTDLEVIHIWVQDGAPLDRVGDYLRLIEPGTKPLHLAIRSGGEPYKTCSINETRAFFERANVTKLYMVQLPYLLELLPSLPQLKVLILANQKRWPQANLPTSSGQLSSDSQDTYPHLDACFLINCTLQFNDMLSLAQHCRPRVVTLYGSTFHRAHPDQKVRTEKVEKDISAFCSEVRTTSARPSMSEHQDLF